MKVLLQKYERAFVKSNRSCCFSVRLIPDRKIRSQMPSRNKYGDRVPVSETPKFSVYDSPFTKEGKDLPLALDYLRMIWSLKRSSWSSFVIMQVYMPGSRSLRSRLMFGTYRGKSRELRMYRPLRSRMLNFKHLV